ncbi:hypothetical protein Dda_6263 [Drechslerella dactyloides]|uniref:Uncharacterized protein n=1 Tax=Drechslerella dactyloides TaxID=74499 RepID=A0AAD6IVH2_DREDA|nr:hypothetical protein Dda_6263 [Drechslerella dactyloides]
MQEEGSLLLYARAYDLVEDHTSISPLSFICLPFDADEDAAEPSTLIASLAEYLPSVGPPDATKERLEATKDAGVLLSQTLALRAYQGEDEDLYARWDSLRLDEPLLRFSTTKPVSKKTALGKLDLKRLVVDEITTDDDRDEGLSFPSYAWDRMNEIIEDVAGDRMTVDRRVLVYLRDTVKVPVVEETEGHDELYEDRPRVQGGITPPLSPLPSPEIPLSPILLEEIAHDFEPLSFDDGDQTLPADIENALLYDALLETPTATRILHEIQQPPSITPSPAKRPLPELHIEVPLTPPVSSPYKRTKLSDAVEATAVQTEAESPSAPPAAPTKRVTFSDIVEEFIIPPSLDPSDDESEAETEDGPSCDVLTRSAMALFTLDVMEPGAMYFLRQLQQEQLEDSTKTEPDHDGLRVDVPIVEWKRPVPRWVHKDRLADSLKNIMDEEVTRKWEYRRSLDIAGLPWAIVSVEYGWETVDEAILSSDEASTLEELISDTLPETIIEDESTEFWKHETGIQDDEDLERAEIEPKMDLDSLVERRKTKKAELPPAHPELSALDPKNHLASFLALQNHKLKPLPAIQIPEPILISSDIVTPPASSQPSAPTTRTSTTREPSHNLPPPPDPASSFIISASFLTNRTLYRAIRSLCPTSTFIERDFDSQLFQNMFGQEDQVPDEPTSEADILVSPLVGIIITNLQTIRQKILPGLPAHSPSAALGAHADGIRDRIAKVSQRYEKLIVGLSIDIGGGSDALELGKTDCAMLAGFIGFCEAMESVQVAVIRDGGGNEAKARWIVEMMGLHANRWKQYGMKVEPTETESSWETFLRYAGMNSYAAQAVLTKLRESECGLVDFVTIEKESRRVIFEPFVGRRVLERLEEVVGAGWLSTQE